MTKKSVLFVFTSATELKNKEPTGWYLPEAARPYYVLKDKALIDFAAPKGPYPPIDENSREGYKEDPDSKKFLNDEEAQRKLATAKRLDQINADDYDALYYVGGHGPVMDLAKDPLNIALASAFYRSDKIVSAICHGPAALVGVTDESGVSIFKGKRATSFSDEEEEIIKAVDSLPFSVEKEIRRLGGEYIPAKPWVGNVVVDGKLITAQNPASAHGLGRAILEALGDA